MLQLMVGTSEVKALNKRDIHLRQNCHGREIIMHELPSEGGKVGRFKVRRVAQLIVSFSMLLSTTRNHSPQCCLDKSIYLTK